MGLTIAWLVWAVIGSLINGWIFSLLWAWFAMPLGAPKIGVAHAIGIVVLVRLVTYDADKPETNESPVYVFMKTVLLFLIMRAMALVVAFCARMAMG